MIVKNNKAVELEELFEGKKSIRNKYGTDFVNELRKSRDEFVDSLYETTRRTVDIHDLLGGHIREQHIGRSEPWLRNRLATDSTLKYVDYASSFRNEEVANRLLGKFAKKI